MNGKYHSRKEKKLIREVWSCLPLGKIHPESMQSHVCAPWRRKECDKTKLCGAVMQVGTSFFSTSSYEADEVMARLKDIDANTLREHRQKETAQRDYQDCRKLKVTYQIDYLNYRLKKLEPYKGQELTAEQILSICDYSLKTPLSATVMLSRGYIEPTKHHRYLIKYTTPEAKEVMERITGKDEQKHS